MFNNIKKYCLAFILTFISIINAQPYLLNVEVEDDPVHNYPPYFLNKINLNNAVVTSFISVDVAYRNYYFVPSNDWVVILRKFCEGTKIYNINDTTNYIEVPHETGCFGNGLLFSGNRNKIYYFEGMGDFLQLTSIDVTSKVIDSLMTLPYSENQTLGNREAFLSLNEEILYFNVADTTYPVTVNDKDFVHYFSTVNNQIIQKRRLYEFGYPNAAGYLLHRGRKGKAIVESFYRNETADTYYRLYDFDNNTGSEFIFYQGYTTPYFTNNGDLLVLPETVDSSNKEINTGRFFVYDIISGNLLKTLTLPQGGEIYTFDNFPNDIYYVRNLDTQPEIINLTKLRLNSITPAISLPYSSGLTVTVKGSLFTRSSQAFFNGQPRTTTYLSDTTLSVQLNAGDLSTVGNYPLWVSNYGSNSDTLTYSVVSALPQPITPLVECVKNNGGGSYTAKFGYSNDNTKSVFVPVGANNKFSPNPENRGQPTIFLPGRNYEVLSVNFDGRNLVWNIFNKKATASKNSTPCP